MTETRTIDGKRCKQVDPPSHRTRTRAHHWMDTPQRDHPGYWVLLSRRLYAYREHTGDITYWRPL